MEDKVEKHRDDQTALLDEVEAARRKWQQIRDRFKQTMAEAGSIPNPDGTLRISLASREYRAAIQKYHLALARLSATFDKSRRLK